MPWVNVQPSDVDLEVLAGETVAEAAWRQGYFWPTSCWGQADCMSCFTKIVAGELSAEPAAEEELDAMRYRMAPRVLGPLVRLACRVRVKRPGLVLEKPGLRLATPHDSNQTQRTDEDGETR
jgi:2Fe-2S ferredoxin